MNTGGEYWLRNLNILVVVDDIKKFGVVECHDVNTGEKFTVSSNLIIDDEHCANFDMIFHRFEVDLDCLTLDTRGGLKRVLSTLFWQVSVDERNKTMSKVQVLERYERVAEDKFSLHIKELNKALDSFKRDLSVLKQKIKARETYEKLHKKEGGAE